MNETTTSAGEICNEENPHPLLARGAIALMSK